MKAILIIAAAAVGLVVAIVLFGSVGDGSRGQGSSRPDPDTSGVDTPMPTLGSNGSLNDGSRDTSPPSTMPAIASGPYLVASDALDDRTASPNQQRVFRNPDGTVAILYHRPAGPDNELQEIVMVHSHDGGRGWSGELIVGREATDATYSGVTDSEGNLYVAYGRNATGASGGAIKLRRLFYQRELHTWQAGPERLIVWDWPGKGAGTPVLAFTGDRLWLVYRYYDGSRHIIVARYADPDTDGEYSAPQWSEPTTVFEQVREANTSASLVSHGTRLSALYADPDIGVSWRLLPDPQGERQLWTLPRTIFLPPNGAQEIRFSAVVGGDDDIHLTVSVEPGFIGYLTYDGTNWSRPRQLAARDVRGPSIASDGKDVWAFWMRDQESGRSQIEFRRWTEAEGWNQAALKLWTAESQEPLPFLLLYTERNRSYVDVTRYAATLSGVDGGQANVARFLEQPGDFLFLGNPERMGYGGLIPAEVGISPSLALEYWNGSTWAPLPINSSPSGENDDSDALSTSGDFSRPEDWQPTDIDGTTGYYLRLRKATFPVTAATALTISVPRQMSGLVAAAEPNRTVDVLWYERSSNRGPSRLWYGAISTKVDQPRNAEAVPDSLHSTYEPKPTRDVGFQQRQMSPLPLPSGLPRQLVSAELDRGERYEYQLLDGQVRYVEVLSTRRVFRSESNVTVWATATIEVSGPGVEPQREEIPAAFFQAPVVLNDVRVYVVITREFDDLRLDGGATSKAARLMLSDARYSLTDLSQYRWPFPGVIWGIRPFQNYYQSLQGSLEKHSHSGPLIQGMPPGMPIQAWHRGTYTPRRVDDGWSASLREADDGVSEDWHRVSPLEGVEWERRGRRVELGDKLSEISGDLTWGGPTSYEWAPLLAEWYMAGSTPIERSYVKDWLVLGPYGNQGNLALGDAGTSESRGGLLQERFLSDEETVAPQEGDVAAEGLTWQRFDGIVPGVIDVAEAVSGYPNSGWARLNDNYPFSVAYLATYVYTPRFQQAVLNIGSSDGVKVWVGENVVLERDAMVRMRRPSDWTIVPDFYRVPVGFKPGWTRILVKLSQGKTSFKGFQSAQRAWQFSFRVSHEAGQLAYGLRLSPERDNFADSLVTYALLAPDISRANRAEPPIARHEWPQRVDLAVNESFIYTLVDGTQRELTLLNYEIVYAEEEVQPGNAPQHVRIDTEVQVRDLDTGTTETTTINVGLGAVPVSVNGLRLLGNTVDLGLPFENVADQGSFPLAEGKDVGFAVNDAKFTLFPDMGKYTYPYELAFGEIRVLHAWLQYQGLRRGQVHAGYDLGGVPCNVPVRAITDGFVTFKWYADQGAVFLNPNGPRTNPGWHMTHVKQEGNLVPNGSWVTKGTPLALTAPGCEFDSDGAFHNGSRGSYDFNPLRFQAEIWQYEHSTDFPSPRFWLALSPFTGDMTSNRIFSAESGDIPEALQPREGDYDKDGEKRWRYYDNYVNSVVRMGEASSPYPFASYRNRPVDSVGYMATYIYSSQDHTNDDEVRLRWGMSYGGKIWLNGKTVFEGVEQRYQTYDLARERPLEIDKYDIVLPLKLGWNTLIIKTNHGRRGKTAWLFSPKIGDPNGLKIPDNELAFSLRGIGLKITRLERTSIDLSWRHVERSDVYVETYLLDVSRDAGFEDLVIGDLDLGKVTSQRVTGLEPGVEYFIRVKPFNYSDMGGTVYWQHIDVANDWTLGSRLGLRIDSPSQGETLSGNNVSIVYSVTGESGEAAYVHFQLDDESVTVPLETVNGVHQFTDVSPGSHLLRAYLLREDNSKIEGTEKSVSFSAIAPPAASPVEWLQVEGNKIVNGAGKPVTLRGVNIENREWEWATSPTIEYERRAIPAATGAPPQGWGANLIVLAVASGPINRNEQLYLDHLDELVALAKASGAYTLLVYRYAEPNDDQPDMPDQAAEDAMASLADRYGDEPAVLYGLQVEPHGVSWSQLSPRFVSMIDAIRANNPRALVFVPGTDWGRHIHHALESPIERDNLVYKTNPYDRWRTIQDEYRLAEVAALYPVVLGEFGSGSSMDLFDVKALLDFAETQGIGWAGWLFHEIACPCMLEKASTFEPSPYGEEVKARLQATSAARKSP